MTHPDVTRYFMTVEEAVQLVLQAAAIGRGSEVLSWTWAYRCGSPTSPGVSSSGPAAAEIVFTGLRPGEKLTEDLLGQGEVDYRPRHPLIRHAPVPPLPPDQLAILDPAADPDGLRQALARCAGSAHSARPPPGIPGPAVHGHPGPVVLGDSGPACPRGSPSRIGPGGR